VDDGAVFGRPDVCFRRARVAVFVDSAFWHGKVPAKRLQRMSAYWRTKLVRNRRRDRCVNKKLVSDGWTVVRVDEQAVLRQPEFCASEVLEIVHKAPRAGVVVLGE
jgi:DNA mismatch endonuclease (patch repair protein)